MYVNNDGIILRKATVDDVNKMSDLDKLCFVTPWTESDFEKEMISNPLALYIVAESKNEIIGYAGLWCIIDEGHITNVAVHPDFRRRGIGKSLIKLLLNKAKEKADTGSFTLEVRVSNEAGIKLYESFGFKEVGIRSGYYSDNKEDAVIMWLA